MIYKFVVLSDENESFAREFEFLDEHTLLDFHNMLQDELEFDKSQMASFFTTTDSWEKEEEFTLFDMGAGSSSTMESAVLEDIIIHKNQKLVYIFDFFNERGLFIEFVGETEDDGSKDLPACTNSKGIPPKQVVFGNRSSRKQYSNIVMSDDDDDDVGVEMDGIDDVDDYFLTEEDDDDSLSDYDNSDSVNEEYEDEE